MYANDAVTSGFLESLTALNNVRTAESGTGSHHNPGRLWIPKGIKITQEIVRGLFYYDEDNGAVLWRIDVNSRAMSGVEAGTINKQGYRQVKIGGKLYLTHRVVWLYVYGYWPENQIDHINRNRLDNRLCNLREVSQQCNMRNTDSPSNSFTGIKGVSYFSKINKYLAYITVGKRHKRLCESADLIEAVAHRLAAEQCLAWNSCDKESPAERRIKDYLRRLNVSHC